MRFKTVLSLVLALSTQVALCAPGNLAGSTAPLAIDKTTQIPGETLKPGDYSITVVDQLADRLIVRIDSKSSARHSIFLGVPALAGNLGGEAGAVFWREGVNKTPTLRGFNFANGRGVEFVFAKAEAAALAKNNSAKVMAVDPQSEGHAALKNLSKDELQVVNLWMLSLTTTGVDNKTPAVLAQRYEERPPELPVVAARAVETPAQAAPAQVASLEVPASVAQSNGTALRTKRKAVVAVLPHTAGSMPLVWLVGLLSVMGAASVRFARARQDA